MLLQNSLTAIAFSLFQRGVDPDLALECARILARPYFGGTLSTEDQALIDQANSQIAAAAKGLDSQPCEELEELPF